MTQDKNAVRKILEQVKAEGRTSLTAPEGKLVCDAYGIPVPKEGVAKSRAEAAQLASGMGFAANGSGFAGFAANGSGRAGAGLPP